MSVNYACVKDCSTCKHENPATKYDGDVIVTTHICAVDDCIEYDKYEAKEITIASVTSAVA